jgi:ribosome-associated translation inhibitor RaiA
MASNKGKTTVADQAPKIEYSGFRDMEEMDMAQIRKASEDFVYKVSNSGFIFTRLSVRLKKIHKVENNQKFEFVVELNQTKQTRSASMIDKNPFKALDLAFKKLLVELKKTQ